MLHLARIDSVELSLSQQHRYKPCDSASLVAPFLTAASFPMPLREACRRTRNEDMIDRAMGSFASRATRTTSGPRADLAKLKNTDSVPEAKDVSN